MKSFKEWLNMRKKVEIDRIIEAKDSPSKTTALITKLALGNVQEDLELSIRNAKRIIQEEEREAEEMTEYYKDRTTGQLNHGGMIKLKSHNHAICKMKEILKLFEGE